MTDASHDRHPSKLSEEETQALRESDPSAFDDDDAGAAAAPAQVDDAGSPASDKTAAGDAGADAPDAKPAGEADETKPDTDSNGDAPPEMIPRPRLDEVVSKSKAKDQIIDQQAAELAQLRQRLDEAKPPKDFKAARKEIKDKYDDGELDEDEYAQALDDLTDERLEYTANVAALKALEQTRATSVQRTWDQEVTDWAARNPGFLDQDGNADVFQRALNSVAAFYGDTISNAELLEKASKQAFEFAGYTPPAAADPATGASSERADQRRAQNAQRAAEASSAPPAVSGGVGERGGPSRGVDLANLKPGTFSSKLSKAEQEKLLGEGAV